MSDDVSRLNDELQRYRRLAAGADPLTSARLAEAAREIEEQIARLKAERGGEASGEPGNDLPETFTKDW